jgi:hypothetical protein
MYIDIYIGEHLLKPGDEITIINSFYYDKTFKIHSVSSLYITISTQYYNDF